MPLSKVRQAEYMREYRKRIRYNVIPNLTSPVIPKVDTSIIKGDVPFYNPAVHKTGDLVRIWQNGKQIEVTVP